MPVNANATPDELRAEAGRLEAKNLERLHGDGDPSDYALSHWGGGLMARKYQLEAEIRDNGGRWKFPALYRLDGTLQPAIQIAGVYGASWMILDAAGDRTGDYAPFAPARESTLAKRGYRQDWLELPARAIINGRGHGLSGTAWVEAVPTGPDPRNPRTAGR